MTRDDLTILGNCIANHDDYLICNHHGDEIYLIFKRFKGGLLTSCPLCDARETY